MRNSTALKGMGSSGLTHAKITTIPRIIPIIGPIMEPPKEMKIVKERPTKLKKDSTRAKTPPTTASIFMMEYRLYLGICTLFSFF